MSAASMLSMKLQTMQYSRKTHNVYISKDVTFESSSPIATALALADETSILLIYIAIIRNQGVLLTWERKVDDLQYANLCNYNINDFVLCSLSFILVNLRLSSSYSWAPSH